MSELQISKGEIAADVRRVARLLGHSPSSVEYGRHGRYDVRTVQRKFALPWRRIVEAAGLLYTPRTSSKIPATDELRKDVERVTREVGHPPRRSEYQARGRFDAETVRRRSGARRWEGAVAWLTGADPEEVKRHQRRGGLYRTTEEWLGRLRDLSRRLGRAPATGEANQAGINAQELRRRVGGGWADVLEAAGISHLGRSRRAAALTASAETVIEDVAAVSCRLGRVPTIREYEQHGRYTYAAIRGRVGGWRRVKLILAEGTWGLRAAPRFGHHPPIPDTGRPGQSAEAIGAFFKREA